MIARVAATLGCSLLLAVLVLPCASHAQVERYALVVGSNRGLAHEATLHYAESDARKVHATLRSIGDFAPENMILLEGESADVMRRVLIDLNDRLRNRRASQSARTVLFVYYSGHADAKDLHLGSTRFAVAELSQLVRGSSADFRLLLVDACRSGVLTRGKGGHAVEPFAIPGANELSGEGLAFLTASGEHELAQESDEIGGSFFTHAFVSGLLGAADRDRDGLVLLDEAYQYAYDNTLRASSRSARGLQHPTFFYDLRGQGQLVLSRPFASRAERGILTLPFAATFLVFQADPHGPVVAEVSARDGARDLSLAPGSYFLRARTSRAVLEGPVRVEGGRTTRVHESSLNRVEYAHLLRKGEERDPVHSLEALAHVRTALPNSQALCSGALLGYRLDLARMALLVRAGLCSSTMEHLRFGSRTSELDLGARLVRAWDLSARVSLEAGAAAQLAYFTQRFATRGPAPTRRTIAPYAELAAALAVELGGGTYLTVDAAFQTYFLTLEQPRTRARELRAAPCARFGAGVGKRF